MKRPIYLDCNATTPPDARVVELMVHWLQVEYGNAGSRTHLYGAEAARAVNCAREQVASVVAGEPGDVVFTSGATESNNLAIQGLVAHGKATGRRHIISTQIEHHAVLEPLAALTTKGFEVTYLAPNCRGWVEAEKVKSALRADTLLVSVMHVNNETGVIQPLEDICEVLTTHEAYFHSDATQGFGKEMKPLQHARLDLISMSAHKIYGPKGVGSLIIRKRQFKRPPLAPLSFGGGQERGLRPGTLPVHLIVGLGLAAELSIEEQASRLAKTRAFRERLLRGLAPVHPVIHGDETRTLSTTVNFSVPGIDSEAAIVALKDDVAVSNGSACTSAGHRPSHVLTAMGLSKNCVAGALRWSWCHTTELPDFNQICTKLQRLM